MKKMQSLFLQLLIRLTFLALSLFGIYLLMVFTYNPHKLCAGIEHRYTMGPAGYLIMALFVFVEHLYMVLYT